MKHPWTTAAGILAIVGGTLGFISACLAAQGFPPAAAWEAFGVSVTAGAGLIKAADAVSEPDPDKTPPGGTVL